MFFTPPLMKTVYKIRVSETSRLKIKQLWKMQLANLYKILPSNSSHCNLGRLFSPLQLTSSMKSNFMLSPNRFSLVSPPKKRKKLILQLQKTEFAIWQEKHIYLNTCGLHVLNPCSLLVSSRHVNRILRCR